MLCRRSFSQQTFAVTYYLKRPELLSRISNCAVEGAADRQIARIVCAPGERCSKSTVALQLLRAGRHGLLLQVRLLDEARRKRKIDHGIVYDDFESFAASQYWPYGVGTAVGSESRFIYSLDIALHRRSGRLSDAQRRVRGRLENRFGHPARGGYVQSYSRLLDLLVAIASPDRQLRVITDDRRGYALAHRRHPARNRIGREVHPNPPRGPRGTPRSTAARRRDRAMFPVDQLHALLRHARAHHRRETIAFGRRHNDQLMREFVFMTWRNLVKRCTERRSQEITPAMKLGLVDRRWTWARVFAARLFPARMRVPARWMEFYRREVDTLPMRVNRRHELIRAF